MFKDRKDAGKKLAKMLGEYRNKDAIVLAIPCGGVEVGCQVADHLNAELSMIIARKLPFPRDPEAGFGAIAEDGSTFIVEGAMEWLNPEEMERIEKEQKEELQRRIKVLRDNKPLPDIKDRIVILVDDGIAMGSTMTASIMFCRKKGAKKIIVAAPVTGIGTLRKIQKIADEVIILEIPPFFQAVAQVYWNWYDVSDSEVVEMIRKWEEKGSAKGDEGI